MSFVRNFQNILTLIAIVSLLTLCASAELRKHKKVRCHPSCCPKPKQSKSLIGRYVLDVADGLEEGGDDFFDLVYVLMKVAKGTYNELSTVDPIGTEGTRRHANESINHLRSHQFCWTFTKLDADGGQVSNHMSPGTKIKFHLKGSAATED